MLKHAVDGGRRCSHLFMACMSEGMMDDCIFIALARGDCLLNCVSFLLIYWGPVGRLTHNGLAVVLAIDIINYIDSYVT